MIPIHLYDVAAMLQIFILNIFVSILGRAPENICCFSYSLQANSWVVPRLDYDGFLPNPFEIFSHLPFNAIRTVQIWTASLNKTRSHRILSQAGSVRPNLTQCTFRIRSKRISTHSVRIRMINILLDVVYLLQPSILACIQLEQSHSYTQRS